jgi:hypothetical protein
MAEDILAREFTTTVTQFCSRLGELLSHCHVKVIRYEWRQSHQGLQCIAVYCPSVVWPSIDARRERLRSLAKELGIADVICLNATSLLRDPVSQIAQADPRFWLELQWIAAPTKSPTALSPRRFSFGD